MPQFNELQTWLLVICAAAGWVLVLWAVLVIIPNRNATVDYLRERNQTLEYWITEKDSGGVDRIPASKSAADRQIYSLQVMQRMLNNQLTRCTADLNFYISLMEKNKSDEQQGTETA